MPDRSESFRYHAPTGTQPSRYYALEQLAKAFDAGVTTHAPQGREAALAHTKIEEALMWAKKAVALENAVPLGDPTS